MDINVWLTSFIILGFQRVKSYMTLKFGETYKIDEILSEWNQYISVLEKRVMQMRDRLQSEIAYHSAEAHRMGLRTYNKLGAFDSRFDEIESMIVSLGPAIMTLMQNEFEKKLQQLARSIQAQSLGAQAQTFLLQGWQNLEFADTCPDINSLQDGKFYLLYFRGMVLIEILRF